MIGPIDLLRYLGRSAMKNGGRALASLVPFGEAAYDLVRGAFDEYRLSHGDDALRKNLVALREAEPAARREAVADAVRLEASGETADVRLELTSYLDRAAEAVPSAVAAPEPVTLAGGKVTYELGTMLAVGDVADLVFVRDPAGTTCLAKIARFAGAAGTLRGEEVTLADLRRAAGDSTYAKYLPAVVDAFYAHAAGTPRVTVFAHEPGLLSLARVAEVCPDLPGVHVGWIFNRLLTILGFAHRRGVFHGAVLPCHVLIRPRDHGLVLVGWGQSVRKGERLSMLVASRRGMYPPEVFRRQPFSPAGDVFMAAKTMLAFRAAMPAEMARFLETCLAESARMRPGDAWGLMEDFAALLSRLYGSPAFHPFPTLDEGD